jgi:hypothetical protein
MLLRLNLGACRGEMCSSTQGEYQWTQFWG